MLAHLGEPFEVGEKHGRDPAFRLIHVFLGGVDELSDDAWVNVLAEGILDFLLGAQFLSHAVEGLGKLADLILTRHRHGLTAKFPLRWPWHHPRAARAIGPCASRRPDSRPTPSTTAMANRQDIEAEDVISCSYMPSVEAFASVLSSSRRAARSGPYACSYLSN